MPTYDYQCPKCETIYTKVLSLKEHASARVECDWCGGECIQYFVKTPVFRFTGKITKGGGPDKFVADMIGIPVKDLPSGLKTPLPPE